MKTLILALCAATCVVGAATGETEGAKIANYAVFKTSQLECVIGNNAELGEHQARYNGVFSVKRTGESESPFVPTYAGLNLEHYFDAGPRNEDGAIFFEPRVAPMSFTQVSETTAELHQPATPHYGVESWTRFEVKEPYYIDMAFRFVPRKADLAGGVAAVFWASYINAPLDKSLYFLAAESTLDKPVWVQYSTQAHGRDSTVCSERDDPEAVAFAGGAGTLYNSFSPLRYSEPFYYGRFRDNVLIYIFEPDPRIRFTHSPSGGGPTPNQDGYNPAWDFQLVIPGYEAGKEYGLKMRLVYKPWVDRADVIAEVRKYLRDR